VPSLRRVGLKRPLFTNGSAQTVREVLHRFRYQKSTVWHHLGDGDTTNQSQSPPAALTDQEIGDLDSLLRYF
jgi:cytochrome c peroxidase